MTEVKSRLVEKIVEAKRKYGAKAAEEIASYYKVENWDGESGCCPFHSEKTPSFKFNEQYGHFKCWGCGRLYDIVNLYMDQGNTYIEAVKRLFENTGIKFDDKEFNTNAKNDKDYFQNYIYPQPETNTNRDDVDEYLGKRGISKQTLDFANIKQDKSGNIVFEHYDTVGKLLCTKYRPSRAIRKKDGVKCSACNGKGKTEDVECKKCKGTGKVKDQMMWWQHGSNTCPILYGVEKIDISKPLLIVEGHIDRLSCIEAGYTNTVSIPHGAKETAWIEFNWEWLENFSTIILWADNDEPGRSLIKEASVRIGEIRCKVVTPSEKIEKQVEEFWSQYGQQINKTDANNVLLSCGKETVLSLIESAADVPIPDVIKLMECPEFDINNALVFDTGVADLDNHIFGYVEGSLNIWTGWTGSGKSSFLLQSCLAETLNKNYGVFMFSGELTTSQLKTWVISQLAGRKHMIEWDNGENKPKTYTPTNDAKKAIETKYMDDIYVYDSFLIATPEAVLSRMEYMRKKHDIRNYIIDNLMCFELDILKYGNELNAQKNLITQFLQFAVRYGAVVHLVAHPRKPNGDLALNEYDILGSSNIPNLAHRIFSLRRTTDKEKQEGVLYDAYVSILKDRLLGVNKKEVGIYYDVPSRRMYGDKDDVNKKYSWDDGSIKYTKTDFGKNGKLVGTNAKPVANPEFMKRG